MSGSHGVVIKQSHNCAEQPSSGVPVHIDCANTRARALFKLGREQEAQSIIQATLKLEPENALTQANQGWIALWTNNHRKALKHFGEALRLDSEFEWARMGIIEALKARNIVYRSLLYLVWAPQPRTKIQWAKLGAIVGIWSVLAIAVFWNIPALGVVIVALPLIAYPVLLFFCWTNNTVSNLLLRFDRFGRLTLSQDQIIASNWGGGFLLVTLLGLIAFLLTGNRGG